ncbi:hypothetical protein [Methanolobus chelungpuianus]|uniref:Uncharacterized protein n=1 Tax=Methanolobus chelungpuianus TaxID=502115 RepID=A0AAE3L181_9EURY|nr:hypothetical protein [Methanolobus chelungpuianus]MCQ6963784.1 hypothetical protein [Methanolobus chelungpuianus]
MVALVWDKELTEVEATLKDNSFYADIKKRISGIVKPRRELPAYDLQLHGPLVNIETPMGAGRLKEYWQTEWGRLPFQQSLIHVGLSSHWGFNDQRSNAL